MPTYQYSCTECGHFFEQFQTFSEDSLTICPQCEGRLRKVFNAVGVVFKGSGFYRTDSRTGTGEKTAAGSDGGAATGEKGSTPKTGAATGGEGGKASSGSTAPAPSGSSAGSSGSSSGSSTSAA